MEKLKAWLLVLGCAAFVVIGGVVLWGWLSPMVSGLFVGGLVLFWFISLLNERIVAVVRIVMFAFFLMIPLTGMFLGYSDKTEDFIRVEKRRPATLAKGDLIPLEQALGKVESWFNDHFAFRSQMIDLYATYMYNVFDKSISPEKVVVGKDCFLFLGNSYAKIIDKTQNRMEIDGKRMSRFGDSMLARQDCSKSKGADFYLVVAPNKHSVYADKLPSNIPCSQETFYDKVYDECTRKGVNLISLRDVLRVARNQYGDDLFIKCDSHWSSLGAYLGAKGLISRVGETHPLLDPPALSGYVRKDNYQGDLLGLARLPSYSFFYQTMLNWTPGAPNLFFEFIDAKGMAGKVYTVDPRQEIPDFSKVRVINKSAKNKLRVLVLKDSFIMAMSPFINNTFYETIYYNACDPEHFGLSQLIERHKPDIVILEIVERDILRSDTIKP
jgi:hypothetical protein